MENETRRRWLFGPATDLLLGCGLAYFLVFALLALRGPEVRELLPFGILPLFSIALGGPHYGATLLRVYEQRDDRRRYVFFSVWATLAVGAAFVVGLYDVWVGSLIVTLYFTWSPWHYTGQNYGLAVMFLRRRGVALDPSTQSHLHVSFVASFLLTFMAVHSGESAANYVPVSDESVVYGFVSLGIPGVVAGPVTTVIVLVYCYTLGVALYRLSRAAPARELLPALLLVGSQALWFVVPMLARATNTLQGVEPLSARHASYAFLWIALAHSAQYLWVTTYYATVGRSEGRAGFWLKALLAGSAIWGVPALLFAPGVLGTLPYDAGLLLMIAAAVNIHHFVLDGAIWKLRDSRIARILVKNARAEAVPAVSPTPRRSWGRGLVWGLGAVSLVVSVVGTIELEFGFRRATERADVDRIERAARTLDRIGRANQEVHLQLGILRAHEGDLDAGLSSMERSLALHPTPEAWTAIGSVRAVRGDVALALDAFRRALALDPRHTDAFLRATQLRGRYGAPVEAPRRGSRRP